MMKVLVILFYWVMKQESKLIAAEAGIDLEGIPILDPRSEETAEKRTSLWRNFFP